MTCKQYTSDIKSLELNRKRALFIGDSIMQGVATNYTITQNTWPKVLSERYAMSHVNNGLSGSCYVAGYNGNIASIEERLYQCDLSEFDLLFMGGGINDWLFDVPIEEFERCILRTFEYLKRQKIFTIIVTPIQISFRFRIRKLRKGPGRYNKVLKTQAEKNGLWLVDGDLFKWAGKSVNNKSILWDWVHPTEYAYGIFAKNVEEQMKLSSEKSKHGLNKYQMKLF